MAALHGCVALPSPGGRGLKQLKRRAGSAANNVALPSPGGRGLKPGSDIPVAHGIVVALPSPGGRGLKLPDRGDLGRLEESPSLHREGAD